MSVGGRRKQQKEGNDVCICGWRKLPPWSLPEIVFDVMGGGVSRKQQQKEGNDDDVAGVNCHRAPVWGSGV
jgi:hypothetical protein